MNVFLDTSTLFKLYHREEGTEELVTFLANHEVARLYISEITSVEFYSAVTKKLRMNEITLEQANGIIKFFETE